MSKAHTTYSVYSANSLPHLTLDDMLAIQDLTHKKYRRWLKDNDKPLYPLTASLMEEVEACSDTMSRHDLSKQFHLGLLDVNKCLYATCERAGWSIVQKERAAQMRQTGNTELDISHANLPVDMEILSLEITARRKKGESITTLAELYGYSNGRISQLDKSSASKPRLTKEAKEAIRASTESAVALAKKYNTTVNTIYVTRREK